ncbi:MAG: CBS domain-containing protein, partial [Chitinophagaceae bacterium]
MLNKDLISASIPTLSLGDTVLRALHLMADYHVGHLPVIAEEKFLGLISEDNLLNIEEDGLLLDQLQSEFINLSVIDDMHFIEAVRIVNEYSLSVMPVIDNESSWVGAITAADLLKNVGRMYGMDEPGGIIVLEIEKRE